MTALLTSLSLAPSWDEIRGAIWTCEPCGTEQLVSGLDKELVKYAGWPNATWPGVKCSTCGEPMAFASRPIPKGKERSVQSQQDEDDARLDAARARGKQESSAQVDAAREAFLSQPSSKPKQRRRTKKEMAALRASQYARADATPETEMHPALLDDPLPPLPFELDDLATEIKAAIR